MKKILVPTDFSPNANRAIDYAVKIATRNQAALYIIHACDSLFSYEAGLTKAEERYNTQITDDVFNKLEILRNSIEETEKILVNTQVYKGTVADTIPIAAKEHGVDLVIMGTLGITSIGDKIFGTNTAAAISNSPIPVLAIPLEYEWSVPSRFLLCINHFDEAIELLNPVFDMAMTFEGEVRIAVFTDEDTADASKFLADAKEIEYTAEKLRRKYKPVPVNAAHLSGKHFLETINEYTSKENIDLLAMTTHKRNFPASIFNRSLTKKMSYHSRIPLLAIPVNQGT